MKLNIYISILLLVFISCSEEKHDEPSQAVIYSTIDSLVDTLTINFSNGELRNEPIPILNQNCICRLVHDTLKINCGTGFGYVGGTFDLRIIKDSVFIDAAKWSCTYTDYYEIKQVDLVTNSKNYHIDDSIAIGLNALMIHIDTARNYIDTLKVNGVIELIVRDEGFSFEKKRQEKRIEEFYDLARNRPDTITSISLHNLDLDFIPDEIELFINLKELDLGSNNLSIEQFGKLSVLQNIEELNISHNKLDQLPAEILNFKNLKRLDIFANKISSFPKGFSKLRLTELQMESNDFKKFPSELIGMLSLRELYMSGNKIDDYESEIKKINQIIDYN